MANARLNNYVLTESDKRVVLNVFKDTVAAKSFLELLGRVSENAKHEQDKVTQSFLMNNDPVTRALALQHKGKVEFLNEFIALVQSVSK